MAPFPAIHREEKILKLLQQENFPEVFEGKHAFCNTSKGDELAKFSPILDDVHLIRIRGCIK